MGATIIVLPGVMACERFDEPAWVAQQQREISNAWRRPPQNMPLQLVVDVTEERAARAISDSQREFLKFCEIVNRGPLAPWQRETLLQIQAAHITRQRALSLRDAYARVVARSHDVSASAAGTMIIGVQPRVELPGDCEAGE